VWLNYTNEPNTFYLGPVVIDASAADSESSCAARCNADNTCYWWTFCPVLEGCEALLYCNVTDAATPQLLPGGTCLLSAEAVPDRIANNAMGGAAVAWSGGKYSPQAGSSDAAGSVGTESGAALSPEDDITSLSQIAGAWPLPAIAFTTAWYGKQPLRCFTCLHMLDCLHACLTSQTCSSAAAAAAGCTRPAALPRLRR
jgi:hypothetical protein